MQLFNPTLAGWFRLALAVAIGVTLWQTLTPSPVPLPGQGSDKLAHFLTFLTLALLTDASWPERPLNWRALVMLAAFGGGIELAQSLVPHRDTSALDMLANLAGIIVYAVAIGPPLRRCAGPRA